LKNKRKEKQVKNIKEGGSEEMRTKREDNKSEKIMRGEGRMGKKKRGFEDTWKAKDKGKEKRKYGMK